MAKLARESRLRERRQEKQAKKEARKLASAHDPVPPSDTSVAVIDESARTDAAKPADDAVPQPPAEASDA